MKELFINLRTYSHYSVGQSIIKLDDLATYCYQEKIPAIALTDYNNLSGSLEFSSHCLKNKIHAIIGAVVTIKFRKDDKEYYGNLLLLAKTRVGYENLMFLVSKSHFNDEKRLFLNEYLLLNNNKDLILICGQYSSPIEQLFFNNQIREAEQLILHFKNVFLDNFFLEITRLIPNFNKQYENFLLDQASKYNIPIVATNQTQFLEKDQSKSLDVLICIDNGNFLIEENRDKVCQEGYLKNYQELQYLFRDIPEAISNTVLIAKKCAYFIDESLPLLPKLHPTIAEEKTALNKEAQNNLAIKIHTMNYHNKAIYNKRLSFELKIINAMNFSGYFLIVSDFIKWAKKNKIPVGAGRGSGAGSLVAWSLDISSIDPIQFNLIFERFLNPERISIPDFDIDFCQNRRDEVIEYVRRKFGYEKVAHIITFGKLQARAVLRDVGRVLQIPYFKVNEICKIVPHNPANPVTLKEVITLDKKLLTESHKDKSIETLIHISLSLEGVHRHVAKHAAGIVISNKPLIKIVPLYKDMKGDISIIQYSLKYAERIGLVKFDFLGLKTLTIISDTCEIIKKHHTQNINFSQIPLNDKKTYTMLSKGMCVGIFQFESSGMREVIKNIKPDTIEDLIALGSLYRPGPMDNITLYIKRKHEAAKIKLIHPMLQQILTETYGIIIYQEQVMKIAQILAGYSLGEADLLRRAMGKKIKQEMEKQRDKFINGCINNNILIIKAHEIFNLLAKFASYGFNKSHAAAYAYISFQTAFLKAHYPAEFMVSLLNIDIDNTDKISIILNEAKKMNVQICSPNINTSHCNFSINAKLQIVFGIGAIKGMNRKYIDNIINERNDNGAFIDIFNFFSRTIKLGINKQLIEGLIKSGSLDVFDLNRNTMLLNNEMLLQYYNSTEYNFQQIDIFQNNSHNTMYEPYINITSESSEEERLKAEFDVFGFYLQQHPLHSYQIFFSKLNIINSSIVKKDLKIRSCKVVGVIVSKKVKSTKEGKYAFLQIADLEGTLDLALFDETLLLHNAKNLKVGKVIFCIIKRKINNSGIRIIVQSLFDINQYLYNSKISIIITIKKQYHIKLIEKKLEKDKGIRVILNVIIKNYALAFRSNTIIYLGIHNLALLKDHGLDIVII